MKEVTVAAAGGIYSLTVPDWFDVIPQDVLDGAALRQLREALGTRQVVISVEAYPGANHVMVGGGLARGDGETIAKAADDCRADLIR